MHSKQTRENSNMEMQDKFFHQNKTLKKYKNNKKWHNVYILLIEILNAIINPIQFSYLEKSYKSVLKYVSIIQKETRKIV